MIQHSNWHIWLSVCSERPSLRILHTRTCTVQCVRGVTACDCVIQKRLSHSDMNSSAWQWRQSVRDIASRDDIHVSFHSTNSTAHCWTHSHLSYAAATPINTLSRLTSCPLGMHSRSNSIWAKMFRWLYNSGLIVGIVCVLAVPN